MSNWVYLENNEVKDYCDDLPESWNNISNFYAAASDLDYLASLGWVKVTHPEYQYNNKTHKLDNRRFVVSGSTVTEEWDIVSLPEPDPIVEYDKFITFLRNERNKKLTESDWTQLNDVISSKPAEWINSWNTYRQMLRDLTKNYPFDSAVIYDVNTIQWPIK